MSRPTPRATAGLIAVFAILLAPTGGQAQSPEGRTRLLSATSPGGVVAWGGYKMTKGTVTQVEVKLYREERNGTLTLLDTDAAATVIPIPLLDGAGLFRTKQFQVAKGVKYKLMAFAIGNNGGPPEQFDSPLKSFVGK